MKHSDGNQLKPISTMWSCCGNSVLKTPLSCLKPSSGLRGVLELVAEIGVEAGRPAIVGTDLESCW